MTIAMRAAGSFMAGLVLLVSSAPDAVADDLKVAMLLPGSITDGGFMEAGYRGLEAIESELGAKVAFIDGVKPEHADLAAALRELAAGEPDMIVAHGGQNTQAVMEVAPEFPDIPFVVVQGGVTGPNVSSYGVLQEQSAWLAGAAAGLLTETGVVGHISGIRVPPGLKGRGGFYNGLMHTNPEAEFLTIFAGDQDDSQLSYDVAKAETEAGADIIFTMLNAGRTGAIDAMREAGVKQIGNVRDWYPDHPDVFVASAIANVSMPALIAARDLAEGRWEPGRIVEIGLEDPEAVSLVLAPEVPTDVAARIDELRDRIVAGEIEVSTEYEGPEFTP